VQGHQLAAFARKNTVLLVAPHLSPEGFDELMESKSVAGHQRGKTRGTFQSDNLDEFRKSARIEKATYDAMEDSCGDDLGDWLEAMNDMAAGKRGAVINYFLNLNKGAPPEKGCKGENGGWHTDDPTDPDKNTGRVLYYQMQKGQLASLRVRKGEAEVERSV
jgi:hypothetical protein